MCWGTVRTSTLYFKIVSNTKYIKFQLSIKLWSDHCFRKVNKGRLAMYKDCIGYVVFQNVIIYNVSSSLFPYHFEFAGKHFRYLLTCCVEQKHLPKRRWASLDFTETSFGQHLSCYVWQLDLSMELRKLMSTASLSSCRRSCSELHRTLWISIHHSVCRRSLFQTTSNRDNWSALTIWIDYR